jgi:hypothetical protein
MHRWARVLNVERGVRASRAGSESGARGASMGCGRVCELRHKIKMPAVALLALSLTSRAFAAPTGGGGSTSLANLTAATPFPSPATNAVGVVPSLPNATGSPAVWNHLYPVLPIDVPLTFGATPSANAVAALVSCNREIDLPAGLTGLSTGAYPLNVAPTVSCLTPPTAGDVFTIKGTGANPVGSIATLGTITIPIGSANVNGSSTDISIGSGNGVYTTAGAINWVSLGFAVNQQVIIGGASNAANNGDFKVTAVTSTALTTNNSSSVTASAGPTITATHETDTATATGAGLCASATCTACFGGGQIEAVAPATLHGEANCTINLAGQAQRQ